MMRYVLPLLCLMACSGDKDPDTTDSVDSAVPGDSGLQTTDEPAGPPTYEATWDGVVELMQHQCISCHSEGSAAPNMPFPQALQIDLATGANALVIPGDAANSALWKSISRNGGGDVMPPAGYLPAASVAHVEAWINAGAAFPNVDLDLDADGFTSDVDCDDSNPEIHPDASEVCDGVDNNCDGQVDPMDSVDAVQYYADNDGDGFGGSPTTLSCQDITGMVANDGDCDDTNPTTFPGAPELCTDLDDKNCDNVVGAVDNDGDGTVACEDCDDNDPNRYPDAVEVCDGVDNNCSGVPDDTPGVLTRFYEDGDGDGFGDPTSTPVDACDAPTGFVANDDDCMDIDVAVHPGIGSDLRDGIDGDCDGLVDEDAGPSSFADVLPVIELHCDGCHSGPNAAGGVNYEIDPYGELLSPSVDVPTMNQVEPFSLADSYVWHKIEDTQSTVGGAGLIMPKPPDPPLTPTERGAFEQWILLGAQP